MSKPVVALLFIVLAQSVSVDAADRIRMGFPDLAAQFLPLSLAEKRDFLKEQSLQGEFIRIRPAISSAAFPPAVWSPAFGRSKKSPLRSSA